MSFSPVPVFDGHNDALLRLLRAGCGSEAAFVEGEPACHLDLERARAGRMVGGFFAIYVPDEAVDGAEIDALMSLPAYDVPLPAPLDPAYATRTALAMMAILIRLGRISRGAVRLVGSVAEIETAMADGALAALPHMEGAEAIDPDLHALEVFHAAGLRSLGPVWSRPTIFGEGVPFRYPSGPDIGGGLTEHGKRLVRACNRLGILVDCSHLNEKGFQDVARISDAPLVATHSNAHALCPHARNLTDRQLDAIRASGGVVGLNFATSFIRPDGRREPDTPLSMMVDQIGYLVDRLGINGVALGSDFDGATIPDAIGDASGLQRLFEALSARGYDRDALERIGYRNWLRVLRVTLGG